MILFMDFQTDPTGRSESDKKPGMWRSVSSVHLARLPNIGSTIKRRSSFK